MIANVINRARNITTPVDTAVDVRAGLDAALAWSGTAEIAEGQVDIVCNREFLDVLQSALSPEDADPVPLTSYHGALIRVMQ